jgi:hypothetical protein
MYWDGKMLLNCLPQETLFSLKNGWQ